MASSVDFPDIHKQNQDKIKNPSRIMGECSTSDSNRRLHLVTRKSVATQIRNEITFKGLPSIPLGSFLHAEHSRTTFESIITKKKSFIKTAKVEPKSKPKDLNMGNINWWWQARRWLACRVRRGWASSRLRGSLWASWHSQHAPRSPPAQIKKNNF